MTDVREVLEAAKQKQEGEISESHLEKIIGEFRERGGVRRLEKVWRVAYLLNNPTGFVEKWTARDMGRANHIVNELGAPAAAQLIAAVVRDWDAFVKYLGEHAHKGVGDRPHIGLLAYHRGVAVEWIQARASACVQEKEDGPSWDF